MRRKSLKDATGFSLIEVMIAMMIFAGAILVINNVWSGNALRIRKARMSNEVAYLLQEKITEMEIKYKNKRLTEIPDEDSGDFGNEHPNYAWRMEAKEFEMPDLTSAIVSEEGADQTTITIVKTMTEFLSKSAKEIKVTVLVRNSRSKGRQNRPLSYSVTTLIVDYNQDLNIPGLSAGDGGGT